MSSLRYHHYALLLVISLLASACANPFAAPPPPPEPTVTPSPIPTPTPVALNATLRLEEGGFRFQYPNFWQTREVSRTVTMAATTEALDATSPGENLVVLIDSVPLDLLAAQHSDEAVSDTEGIFRISSEGPLQAGYALSETETIMLDGQQGLAANLHAAGGEGRLVVLRKPPNAIRVLGQAAPGAWQEQQGIFEDIVNSIEFFTPEPVATPTPERDIRQPLIITEGPAGFVMRLGSTDGPLEGRFVSTRGLSAAPDGTLYVSESSQGIWVFESDGTLISTFGGDDLLDAYDVALGKNGDIFVADYGRNDIARFDPDGNLVQRWGQTGDQPEQFGLLSPQRIAIGPDGSIYALDSRVDTGNAASSVIRFSAEDGSFIERITLPAGSAPNDLAVDSFGNIYLAETFSGGVTKVDAQGQLLDSLGDDFDGQGITAGAIDIDIRGNIYVATWSNGILKFSPDGALLAAAGSIADSGTTPQPGQFSLPNGIAAAPGEIVWVSDNAGEYSAVTALRLFTNAEAQATADAQATAEATPIPQTVLSREWASEAIASSQYNEDYGADGATGPPDVDVCRSSTDAWAPISPGTLETMELEFDQPLFATNVNVYQSHQPGTISMVEVLDEQGDYTMVYSGTATLQQDTCPDILQVSFGPTLLRIVGVRLTIDQRNDNAWTEIDAVELVGLQ